MRLMLEICLVPGEGRKTGRMMWKAFMRQSGVTAGIMKFGTGSKSI